MSWCSWEFCQWESDFIGNKSKRFFFLTFFTAFTLCNWHLLNNDKLEKKISTLNNTRWFNSNLMMPSSAALQKVLGHMGAVAMRLTLLVWSENIWMVSFTVRSCTWTFVSAAPVTRILSPEWGRNCVGIQKHQSELKYRHSVSQQLLFQAHSDPILASKPQIKALLST